MLNLLLETQTTPTWVTESFPIIWVVLMIAILLLSIAVIVIVMCMESHPEGGSNVISGQSDSFYSRNKGSNKEGRLKRAIIICGIAIVVLVILFWITWSIVY